MMLSNATLSNATLSLLSESWELKLHVEEE
jgi:hypothetical protein